MNGQHFPSFGTDAIHVGQEPEQWSMHQVRCSFVCSGFELVFPLTQNTGYIYAEVMNKAVMNEKVINMI